MDIGGRVDESDKVFLEQDIDKKDPMDLFEKWYNIARSDPRIMEANAMSLATATKSGMPSSRILLLNSYDRDGFRFFTTYTSRKGKEIEENPLAAIVFYWDHYKRSVRIEGKVKKLPTTVAENYFNGRPYVNQIGALVEGRQVLVEKEEELSEKYPPGKVPRPPTWGGYIVKPYSMEFWQGQTTRVHDRIRFRKPKENEPDGVLSHQAENGWIYERLAP